MAKYRLDGDIEYHDPAEPSTTLCPFLPGQLVNILEVPMQIKDYSNDGRNASTSSIGSVVFTMNPNHKYLSPKPSIRQAASNASNLILQKISAAASRHGSILKSRRGQTLDSDRETPQLGTNVERQAPPTGNSDEKSEEKTLVNSDNGHSALIASFEKMRRSKSLAWNSGRQERISVLSRSVTTNAALTRRSRNKNKDPFDTAKAPKTAIGTPASTPQPEEFARAERPNSEGDPVYTSTEEVQLSDLRTSLKKLALSQPKSHDPEAAAYDRKIASTQSRSSIYSPIEEPRDLGPLSGVPLQSPNFSSNFVRSTESIEGLTDHYPNVDIPPGHESAIRGVPQKGDEDDTITPHVIQFQHEIWDGLHSPLSSNFSNDPSMSPCLDSSTAYTGPVSPCHLSQPETPLTTEFNRNELAQVQSSEHESAAHLRNGGGLEPGHQDIIYPYPSGFQGYSLPPADQASVLTLRKSPVTAFVPDVESQFVKQGNQDFVRSWDDGSEHLMTSMEELVNEMGYLGEVIL